MQLSAALHRRPPPPGFSNHTPRAWEITAVNPSQSLPYSDDMFGLGPEPGAMSIGAGPLYSNASAMGQTSSSARAGQLPTQQQRREKIRKANSTTILRQDFIQQTFEASSQRPSSPQTLSLSRPESWSMHYDCTSQAPYLNKYTTAGASNSSEDRMMPQTSLARLPKENSREGSHDLAFFLRTTGPTAPHRRPSKVEHPRRTISAKNAFRLFKSNGEKRRTSTSQVQTAHERLNGVLRDEGGLLLPKTCQQKLSSTGKRYLALVPERAEHDEDTPMHDGEEPSILSNGILESRVSVCCFDEDVTSATGDALDTWLSALNQQSESQRPSLDERKKPASNFQDVASRLARQHQYPTPVRPAASEPPSPIPESMISMDSYRTDFHERPPPKVSFDASRALTSHPISPIQESRPQTPKISLPCEDFPVKHPSPDKEVEIKHPLPRRLGSHPVLLQRASSIASTMYQRSVSDYRDFSESPGPPPPKSPLRLRRDPRTIDNIMTHSEGIRSQTPRIAPSIRSANDLNLDQDPIRATITTTCTGPLSRPRSSGKSSPKGKSALTRVPYPTTKREREERVRARKLRDKPSATRTIDSYVHNRDYASRQRLKRMTPSIQIPAPLRASSAGSHASDASSLGSWKKVTQTTLSPVSPMPSLADFNSQDDNTGYTPISPSASTEARSFQAGLEMSPIMMLAEKVPVPKTTKSPKPPKLILKDSKSKVFKPRPRSASLPRNAFQHRSRHSTSSRSSPRNKSHRASVEDVPPLPSPAPMRALPPTPPQSGSEKPTQNTGAKRIQSRELSTVPSHDVSPISTGSKKHYPHIATQRKTSGERKVPGKTANRASTRMNARLEALEKQNALLQAALMAVLKTNGELNNGRLPSELGLAEESSKGPMAWETRVARRSAATTATTISHGASSSNGSALDMYMNTRQGC